MSHVLILGGTAEARDLAARLDAQGVPLTSSLAGRVSQPRLPVGPVRIGGFGGVAGLTDWLREHEVSAVVDATHPFAATMGAHAAQACSSLGVPLLRLAWPAYTNEAIFLFHATTLVFFSGFPAIRQMGDSLYYASYFADKTFNPFVAYPIVAGYFILLTLGLIALFGVINRRLNRHLPGAAHRLRYRPKLLR